MKKKSHKWEKWATVFLLSGAFLLRFWYPLSGAFAFKFDQGKDSLNALAMLVEGKPTLLGPWTSIPGLYFGPAWHYLVALFLAVGNLSPAAPVWGMVGLMVGQVYLVKRYFGKVAAAMVAGGTLWLTISTSAWNPFPLVLISWGILVLLLKIKQEQKLTRGRVFGLALLASFGFHFSSAYAIFYPLIVGVSLGRELVALARTEWRQLGLLLVVALLGFGLPFLPQLVFELRHDWLEVRAVGEYWRAGGEMGDRLSLEKVLAVGKGFVNELRVAVVPDLVWGSEKGYQLTTGFCWLALAGVGFNFLWVVFKKGRKEWGRLKFMGVAALFVVIPLVGFSFLHFNSWYLLGMMPALVVIVSQMVWRLPKWGRVFWVALFILGGVSVNLREFWWQNPARMDNFYLVEQAAWEAIKADSGGRNFALYVYQGEIYDYNYQYLIMRDGLLGRQVLPVEFSYQAGESDYVPGKAAVLAKAKRQEGEVELIYYLAEEVRETDDWWWRWQGDNLGWREAQEMGNFGLSIQVRRLVVEEKAVLQ